MKKGYGSTSDRDYQALLGKATDVEAEVNGSEIAVVGEDGIPYSHSLLLHDGSGDKRTLSRTSWLHAFAVVSLAALTLTWLAYPHSTSYMIKDPMLQLNNQVVHSDRKEDEFSSKEQQSMFEGAFSAITNEPLSFKSPAELGIPVFHDRPDFSLPGSVFGSVQKGPQVGMPLPTNEWYLNLIVGLNESPGENGQYENFAGEENRVFCIPYIVDTVGTVVGIRLHYPNVVSYGTVVQSVFVSWHGLTLGTADEGFTRRYQVDEGTLPSKLGIGIRWEKNAQSQYFIRSRILRGMPYGTMEYSPGVQSVIASEVAPKLPLIDGSKELGCGTLDPHNNQVLEAADGIVAKRDIELYFPESDFTWLVFFSKPVHVRCFLNPNKVAGTVSMPPGSILAKDNRNAFQLTLDPIHDHSTDTDEPLIVRVALANNCTFGTNVNFCSENRARDQSDFKSILREHAGVYPTSPTVKYSFSNPEGGLTPETPDSKIAYLFFDWNAKDFTSKASKELIMFALPHHVDILRRLDGLSSNEIIGHCKRTLHGNTCLVKGGLWAMEEVLGGLPSFVSPRPANHRAIPALAEALSKDILYALPDNYMRGAGDTYFSGKMLAKLGRVIVIAQELRGLAETPDYDMPDTSTASGKELFQIIQSCKNEALPTEEEVVNAIDRLKQGVEVWLNGTSLAPLTYDNSWGGIVSCGCWFNGEDCDNSYPNCPSYTDPGLNFGQGFYNDHHFHYGYHIYAAAIVAQYDREWGRRYFEKVMLLIRDIANPSVNDEFFPVFRQKDWYLGNSWASGIALFGGRPYMNGRNQESSSEAIAAYEGIAMFGSVMMKAFGNGKSPRQSDNDNAYTACQVFNIGRFLATTEIRSADRYWHVYSPKRDAIYPDSYKPSVVSMMWDTMCQFQTWFGSAPYLAYGIQLLPLTPISERRDTDQWLRQMYPSFVESCESNDGCVNEGWAILLYAVLATLGHKELALEKVLAMPEGVFLSAGGSGHSLSNTLWYISSRPTPIVPYDLEEPSTSINSKPVPISVKESTVDCGCPDTCTNEALETNADGFTCKERIQWLMINKGLNELGACEQVAGNEYISLCSACNPKVCAAKSTPDKSGLENVVTAGCPPCNEEICASDMNRCQISTAPYLCYEGLAAGGCTPETWITGETLPCSACCELYEGC
ncbi:hypothetical protein HJC23_010989 [Cyclotella cryptica]|uniref:glucan endo-1,3-beta-D-glucosidase n=1 Tax=Cyclotella cryptica TaxID=29204 RepID=A0ABD3PZY7_9STRA|eukprot:CCRYP_010297-RB/>CCRYP_010297-RB protein AED:0.05 eAED:0.05 QI:399/1/1/1/1/1/9/63/1165